MERFDQYAAILYPGPAVRSGGDIESLPDSSEAVVVGLTLG